MRIVKIILFSLYYLFLALFITFQALFYDALVNGEPLPSYYKNISLGTLIFSVFLLLFGLMNLGGKYQRWFPKKLLLAILVGFMLWVTGSFIYLYEHHYPEIKYYWFFVIPLFPALLHGYWFYWHYDQTTYSLKEIENSKFNDFSGLRDLDLPFVKFLETGNNYVKIRVTVPYNISNLLAALFAIVWVSIWTFASTVFFQEYPFAILMYLISLLVIYAILNIFFSRIYIVLTPLYVEMRKKPFNQFIRFADILDVDFTTTYYIRGGSQHFIRLKNDRKAYISTRHLAIPVVIRKILEIHFSLNEKGLPLNKNLTGTNSERKGSITNINGT